MSKQSLRKPIACLRLHELLLCSDHSSIPPLSDPNILYHLRCLLPWTLIHHPGITQKSPSIICIFDDSYIRGSCCPLSSRARIRTHQSSIAAM